MSAEQWEEEVRERLMAQPDAPALEDFGEHVVRHLMKCTPQAAVQEMIGSKEALDELRRLESVCDVGVLRRFFLSGDCQALGRDRQGRPVFWHRGFVDQARWTRPYPEVIVYETWVSTWAWRLSPSASQSILCVYDETALDLPDFNLGYCKSLGEILRNLFIVTHPDSRSIFFLRNKLFTFFASLPMKILGNSGPTVPQFKTDQREVLSMLEDPTEYPDWFLPGGKPFAPSFQNMGNFMDVLEKQGFSNLTLRDIHVSKVPDTAQGSYIPSRMHDLRVEHFLACSISEPNLQSRFNEHSFTGDGEYPPNQAGMWSNHFPNRMPDTGTNLRTILEHEENDTDEGGI